uniref:hypothetical protein n=1 Tax=Candidatus Entotheonella palauensis TaxID=93172 RepID=UPI001177C967
MDDLPTLRISAAATELVKGVLALYPQASIVPRLTPLEDEDISIEVQLGAFLLEPHLKLKVPSPI